jgi:Tfp pilus assembly protein PilO
MSGLPMEVIAPVVGFSAIILSVATGIVMVKFFSSKFRQQELKSGGMDPAGRDRMLEDLQIRVGELEEMKQRMVELEERVDFTERLLANPREGQRLGPPAE